MFKKLRQLFCLCKHSVVFSWHFGTIMIGQCKKCGQYWLAESVRGDAIKISAKKAAKIKREFGKKAPRLKKILCEG